MRRGGRVARRHGRARMDPQRRSFAATPAGLHRSDPAGHEPDRARTLDPTGNNVRWRYAAPRVPIAGAEVRQRRGRGAAAVRRGGRSPAAPARRLRGDPHWTRDLPAADGAEVRLLGADGLIGVLVGDEVQAWRPTDGAVRHRLPGGATSSSSPRARSRCSDRRHAVGPRHALGGAVWDRRRRPARAAPVPDKDDATPDVLLVPDDGGFAHRDPATGAELAARRPPTCRPAGSRRASAPSSSTACPTGCSATADPLRAAPEARAHRRREVHWGPWSCPAAPTTPCPSPSPPDDLRQLADHDAEHRTFPGGAGPLSRARHRRRGGPRHRAPRRRLHRQQGGLRAAARAARRGRLPRGRHRPARAVRVARPGRPGRLLGGRAGPTSSPSPACCAEESGEPLHLLGHSFGGLVTRAAVLAEPGLFTSFTLLGSGPSRLTGRRADLLDHLGPLLDAGGVELVHETLEQVAMTDPKAQAVPGADPRVLLPAVPEQLRGRPARDGRRDAYRARPGGRAGRDRAAAPGGARRGRRRLAAARPGRDGRAAGRPARGHQQLDPLPAVENPRADPGGAARLLGRRLVPARDPAAGSDWTDEEDRLGFFGPDSVTWRVHSDPSFSVGGLRALLLQALHPVAMDGVARFSGGFREEPWPRLIRTATYVDTLTFGTRTEAVEAVAAGARHPPRGWAAPRRRPAAPTGSTTPTCCSGCTAARSTRCSRSPAGGSAADRRGRRPVRRRSR